MQRLIIALKTSNIESIYSTLKLKIPDKMKVAMFLVHQFEHDDFDFDSVVNEEKLQEKYELMEAEEIRRVTGIWVDIP